MIASNCPTGPSEIVQHGVNGWLFPPADEAALRNILENIVNKKVQLPAVEKCKDSVLRFSSSNMVHDFENFFAELNLNH